MSLLKNSRRPPVEGLRTPDWQGLAVTGEWQPAFERGVAPSQFEVIIDRIVEVHPRSFHGLSSRSASRCGGDVLLGEQ